MTRPQMLGAGFAALTLVLGLLLVGRFSADPAPTTSTLPEAEGVTTTQNASPTLHVETTSSSTNNSNDLLSRIAALEEALRIETQARSKLEIAVKELQPAHARNSESTRSQSARDAAEETNTIVETASPSAEPPVLERPQALAQLGVDTFRATQLSKQVEEIEMQHLILRDKASREGWANSPRYTDAVRKLPDESDIYRKELGDNNYDAFLYRTGQPNRVSVQSVLAGSPAQKAGVEGGDLIFSYANERVFSWADLTGATGSGEPGQSVLIELVRNGKKINVYVPRGPLGVRMSADRSAP